MFNPCANTSVVLENGTVISKLQDIGERWEVPSQIKHIKEYFKHGIEVKDGDVIFDIGANIGLFGLTAYDLCHKDATVYCFEPVPATYDDLEKNLASVDPDKLKAYRVGFSNTTGKLEFTHYPNAPGLSTIYPENMQIGLEQMIENIDNNMTELPDFFVDRKEIQEEGKQSRFNKMRTIFGLKTVFQETKIYCDVMKLSEFLENEKIEKIDLLKIDVNGSELDILEGIKSDDFSKIEKIVIEVPLGGEKLVSVELLLKKNGFQSVKIQEQNPVINKGLSYYIVYAVK